jgi:hypothetical protein
VRRILRTSTNMRSGPDLRTGPGLRTGPDLRTGPGARPERRPRTRRPSRRGRLPGRWLAAGLIAGAVALLVPGVSYATAAQSSPASQSAALMAQTGSATSATSTASGCLGVSPAVIPAVGFITNPDRSQAGHLWWASEAGGVCIGTVIEWVQYNATATKTWQVIVYDTQHPNGQVVAGQTFTLGQGWYWFGFGVHQVFPGLSAVCVTASDSFGVACLHFSS